MAEETKKPTTNKGTPQEDHLIAAIGYLGLLCFVPLLLKPDSDYAQFHGKQGLSIFIVEVVIAIVGIIPVLGWLISMVGFIVCALASVYGIINAMQGNKTEIPGFSIIHEKLNI